MSRFNNVDESADSSLDGDLEELLAKNGVGKTARVKTTKIEHEEFMGGNTTVPHFC